MEARCPVCGLYQDPFAPQCPHMTAWKSGVMQLLKLGPDYFRRIANKRNVDRWKKRGKGP